MSSEKFIRNNTALITLIAASLVVLISLGVRQTFGMFFTDFKDDLGISLTQSGLSIGIQMLMWGLTGPIFGAPNIGPVNPHINICIPIDNPDWVKEIPKSSLKSVKNIPKVCLTPNEIKTTKLAAIKVIKAVLFLINFSEDMFLF